MNKQELIKRIEVLPYTEGPIADTITINRNWILESIEQLDEPQNVTIPQVVAEIIEYYKGQNATLYDALREKNFNKQYNEWLMNEQDAYNKVARAWLDGYEVEEEKRYVVTLKNGQPLVKSQSGSTLYFSQDITAGNYKVTRKELEKDGFGEVFNSPFFEVVEVE